MEVGILLFAVVDRTEEVFILKENTILNILCDECEVLIDDSAGTDIHVANLRVAHLSVRKSYCKAGCKTLNIRALSHKLVDNGSLCHCDGIVFLGVGKSETVKNHKYYRSALHIILLCI